MYQSYKFIEDCRTDCNTETISLILTTKRYSASLILQLTRFWNQFWIQMNFSTCTNLYTYFISYYSWIDCKTDCKVEIISQRILNSSLQDQISIMSQTIDRNCQAAQNHHCQAHHHHSHHHCLHRHSVKNLITSNLSKKCLENSQQWSRELMIKSWSSSE